MGTIGLVWLLPDSLDNPRHCATHDISMKLFDLVNASARFNDLFKKCQVGTGEAIQFKDNNPVEVNSWPMHRWESTLKFNGRIMLLVRSVESFMAEVINRKWATALPWSLACQEISKANKPDDACY